MHPAIGLAVVVVLPSWSHLETNALDVEFEWQNLFVLPALPHWCALAEELQQELILYKLDLKLHEQVALMEYSQLAA